MHLNYLVPILGVADVQRSLNFYRETLGFEVMNTFEPEGRLCWALAASGTTRIMFSLSEAPKTDKDAHLYFYPDHVGEVHAMLKGKGYEVTDLRVTFYGMREFDLADPDGFMMTFGQHTHALPSVKNL